MLLSTKGALIIAAALLGGFGILAVVVALSARRVMSWRPSVQMPELPDFQAIAKRFRQRDAA